MANSRLCRATCRNCNGVRIMSVKESEAKQDAVTKRWCDNANCEPDKTTFDLEIHPDDEHS